MGHYFRWGWLLSELYGKCLAEEHGSDANHCVFLGKAGKEEGRNGNTRQTILLILLGRFTLR